MYLWLLRPAKWLAQIAAGADSPRQIGWGFALGMVVGLVPKDNLCAVLLLMLLLGTRCHRGAGLLAAFVFSWVGLLLDPLSHRLGYEILAYEPLRPYWRRVWELPLLPWTSLNNTVVLGSLSLGVLLFWPVYVLATDAAAWLRPYVGDWLRRRKADHILAGADLAAGWRGE